MLKITYLNLVFILNFVFSSSFIYAQATHDVASSGNRGFRYVIDTNNPAGDINKVVKVYEITNKSCLFVYDFISSEKNSLPLDPISNPLKPNHLDQIMLAGEGYRSPSFNPLPLPKSIIFIISFLGVIWIVRKSVNTIVSGR